MNLHALAAGAVGAVNPPRPMQVLVSVGDTVVNYVPTPAYARPQTRLCQVQPMTWRDLQQVDALNLQGTRVKIYVNGRLDGLVRQSGKGGDLIIDRASGDTYLVAQVIEGWTNDGWCCVAATLQDGS